MRAAEAFARAREADLPALWAGAGHALSKSGSRLVSNWCPCCGGGSRRDRLSITREAGIWRWRCFGCQQGGTAVDFVARVHRLDPIEAARRIASGNVATTPVPEAPTEDRGHHAAGSEAFVACIHAMRRHGVDPDVMAYLESRGIRRQTAERAHASGLLVTLPAHPPTAAAWLEANVGRKRMQEAGLWSKRWPAAAYRPLVFAGPTAEVAEFRHLGAEDGSPKAVQFGRQDFPLVLRPSGAVERIVIIEGGVDLLSMMDMGEDKHTLLVGLYGTGSWRERWAKTIASKYPAAEWHLATDADLDGDRCAARIVEHLEKLGVKAKRWRPFVGKDWNDALRVLAA